MLEQVLEDIYVSDHDWKVILLRYFNPSEPTRAD